MGNKGFVELVGIAILIALLGGFLGVVKGVSDSGKDAPIVNATTVDE